MNMLTFGSTYLLSAQKSACLKQFAPADNPREGTQAQRKYLAHILSEKGEQDAAKAIMKDLVTGATLADGTELVVVGDQKDNDYMDFLQTWERLHPTAGKTPLDSIEAEYEIDRKAGGDHLNNLRLQNRTIAVI